MEKIDGKSYLKGKIKPEYSGASSLDEFELEVDEALDSALKKEQEIAPERLADFDNDGQWDDQSLLEKYFENPVLQYLDIGSFKHSLHKAIDQLAFFKENEASLQQLALSLLKKLRELSLDSRTFSAYFSQKIHKSTIEDYEGVLFNLEKGFAFISIIKDLSKRLAVKDNSLFNTLFLLFEKRAKSFRRMGADEKKSLENLAMAFQVRYLLEQKEIVDLPETIDLYLENRRRRPEGPEMPERPEEPEGPETPEGPEVLDNLEKEEELVVALPALKSLTEQPEIPKRPEEPERAKGPEGSEKIEMPEEDDDDDLTTVFPIDSLSAGTLDLGRSIEKIDNEALLKEAKSFADLISIIEKNKIAIQGSSELFTAENLVGIVEKIASHEWTVDKATRRDGFREKLIELLNETNPAFAAMQNMSNDFVGALDNEPEGPEEPKEPEGPEQPEESENSEQPENLEEPEESETLEGLEILEEEPETLEELEMVEEIPERAEEELESVEQPEQPEQPEILSEALAEVDLLTTEEEARRNKLEKDYELFLNLYKERLLGVKEERLQKEARLAEIKAMDKDYQRLDTDPDYLRQYGDLCRELTNLCIELQTLDKEIARLELLSARYEVRFDIIKTNSRLTVPVQKNEERWLNEISEGSGDNNYLSISVDGKVYDVAATRNGDAWQLSFNHDQAEELVQKNGILWQEISDQKNIDPADRSQIAKWMEYGFLIDNADYLTKLRKRELFYELQNSRNLLAFSIEKKYGAILPTVKSNIPIYFDLEQARINNKYLEKVEILFNDYISSLSKEENRAYVEIILYQSVLRDISINRDQIEKIKNRLNDLLIKHKKIKAFIPKELSAYNNYLDILSNGLFILKKKEEMGEAIKVNVKAAEIDAAGRKHISHEADLNKVEADLAKLEKQKPMKEKFIRYYLIDNLKDLAREENWPKKNLDDFIWFIEEKVAKVLLKEDLSTYTGMIDFLKEYPEKLPKGSEYLGSFDYLRNYLLYLE